MGTQTKAKALSAVSNYGDASTVMLVGKEPNELILNTSGFYRKIY